ncbi:glycoside hydrolase family 19 protein [Methylobacterium sp. JK268]
MTVLLNAAAFFDAVRASVFAGSLTQCQVDGINRLLAAFTLYGSGDRRHLAYGLATSRWETGARMMPVREGFAKSDAEARAAVARLFAAGRIRSNYALPNKAGLSFYGRGDVQLTHETNYITMEALLGLPLATNPDLALDPAVSARIMWEGLLRGLSNRGDFTGKSLEDFIHGSTCDYVGARRTVNGTDHAEDIARFARAFEAALIAGGMPAQVATVSALTAGARPIPESVVPRPPVAPVGTAPVAGGLFSGVLARLRAKWPAAPSA